MKMIGSDHFTVKRSSTVSKGQYGMVNQYLIRSTDENSSQFLYADEYEINELINLLEKVKELL